MKSKVDTSKGNKTFWKNGVEYEMVAPEGGWGFLICLALVLIFSSTVSHMSCFGLIYNDVLKEWKLGMKELSFANGVSSMTLALTGFANNMALKMFSVRQVGLLGAILYSIGAFFAIFVRNINDMIFTGFFQASGMGLLMPIVYTSFNGYFKTKRALFLSSCKVIVGIASMLAPLLVKFLMETYGFRGTLAIICGISMQSIVGATLLQPVEWHLVPKRLEGGIQNLIEKPEPAEESQPAVEINNPIQKNQLTSKDPEGAEALLQRPSRKAFHTEISVTEINNLVRASSIASLGNWTNNVVEPLPPVKDKKGKIHSLVEFLDLNLLTDFVYVNTAFGIAISFFSDLTYFTYLPLLLFERGWTPGEVAASISLSAVGDMVSRIGLVIVSKFFKIKSRVLYLYAAFLTVAVRNLLQNTGSTPVILTFITMLGFLRSCMHVTNPLVMAEAVPLHRYPAAYGLYMFLFGIMNLVLGIFVGFLRDVTQSFWVAFNVLDVCMLLCAVPWSIELYLRRNKNVNTGTENTPEEKQ